MPRPRENPHDAKWKLIDFAKQHGFFKRSLYVADPPGIARHLRKSVEDAQCPPAVKGKLTRLIGDMDIAPKRRGRKVPSDHSRQVFQGTPTRIISSNTLSKDTPLRVRKRVEAGERMRSTPRRRDEQPTPYRIIRRNELFSVLQEGVEAWHEFQDKCSHRGTHTVIAEFHPYVDATHSYILRSCSKCGKLLKTKSSTSVSTREPWRSLLSYGTEEEIQVEADTGDVV